MYSYTTYTNVFDQTSLDCLIKHLQFFKNNTKRMREKNDSSIRIMIFRYDASNNEKTNGIVRNTVIIGKSKNISVLFLDILLTNKYNKECKNRNGSVNNTNNNPSGSAPCILCNKIQIYKV